MRVGYGFEVIYLFLFLFSLSTWPITNARLAMVAITGLVSQNDFFGTTGPERWLPGGAFETELGVQSLWGSWTRWVCLRTVMSTPSSAAALRS